MSQYRRASEAEGLAIGTVIPTWKPFLSRWDIEYVLNAKPMKSRGVDVWAKIKKCSPLEKHLTDHDLLVIINEAVWNRLSRGQRLALLHHEFCHVDEDDDGELVMLPHDLEEFAEVVKVHGLWRQAVETFASQLELSLNEGVRKPRAWLGFEGGSEGTSVGEVLADAEEGRVAEVSAEVEAILEAGGNGVVDVEMTEGGGGEVREAALLDEVESGAGASTLEVV